MHCECGNKNSYNAIVLTRDDRDDNKFTIASTEQWTTICPKCIGRILKSVIEQDGEFAFYTTKKEPTNE